VATATIPVTPVREPVRHDTDTVSKPAEPVSEILPTVVGKAKKVVTSYYIWAT